MKRTLQIVSFNVPYPPNYGGVIDVFYKIKYLSELGYEIILHTFDYGRGKQDELNKYCKQVYYYPRKRSFFYIFSKLPFIVRSRKNKDLLTNLKKYEGTIIFEGIHTSYWVYKNALKKHQIVIRTHNIEYLYYQGLALTEKNFFKRLFFLLESSKLRKYELYALSNADHIAAISPNDAAFFKQYFSNVSLILPFHDNQELKCQVGIGNYILIHGDLSVPENICSTEWLIENVILHLQYPAIIAGKNPHRRLKKLIEKHKHIKLIPNPDFNTMEQLITEAQIILIHSFHPQGMKLKLLDSLYKGRFVIVNKTLIDNTGIEQLCFVAENKEDYIIHITALMNEQFNETIIQKRKEILKNFATREQANRLSKII